MISGSYHLKRNILRKLTEQIQPNSYQDRSNQQSNYDNTFHCNYFSFDTEQIQANNVKASKPEAISYDSAFVIIFLLILNRFKQTMSKQARQKQ